MGRNLGGSGADSCSLGPASWEVLHAWCLVLLPLRMQGFLFVHQQVVSGLETVEGPADCWGHQ